MPMPVYVVGMDDSKQKHMTAESKYKKTPEQCSGVGKGTQEIVE
ncbi:hypothetical protein [Acinetobacter sp. YH12219]|nr:hypothetical protein [Acinetobacter sp. YH12219]